MVTYLDQDDLSSFFTAKVITGQRPACDASLHTVPFCSAPLLLSPLFSSLPFSFYPSFLLFPSPSLYTHGWLMEPSSSLPDGLPHRIPCPIFCLSLMHAHTHTHVHLCTHTSTHTKEHFFSLVSFPLSFSKYFLFCFVLLKPEDGSV